MSARTMKARYHPWSVAVELKRTLPLNPGEVVVLEGAVHGPRSGVTRKLVYIRLSDRRLCILEHILSKHDLITEAERAAVRSIEPDGRDVVLRLASSDGEKEFRIRPWAGPRHVSVRPLRLERDALATQLRSWANEATAPETPY